MPHNRRSSRTTTRKQMLPTRRNPIHHRTKRNHALIQHARLRIPLRSLRPLRILTRHLRRSILHMIRDFPHRTRTEPSNTRRSGINLAYTIMRRFGESHWFSDGFGLAGEGLSARGHHVGEVGGAGYYEAGGGGGVLDEAGFGVGGGVGHAEVFV